MLGFSKRNEVVLEFGSVSGGPASFEVVTAADGACLAADLVRIFSTHIDRGIASSESYWHLDKSVPRAIWASPKHYVALTRLDFASRLPPVTEAAKGKGYGGS
jgi:hypothetical protein